VRCVTDEVSPLLDIRFCFCSISPCKQRIKCLLVFCLCANGKRVCNLYMLLVLLLMQCIRLAQHRQLLAKRCFFFLDFSLSGNNLFVVVELLVYLFLQLCVNFISSWQSAGHILVVSLVKLLARHRFIMLDFLDTNSDWYFTVSVTLRAVWY